MINQLRIYEIFPDIAQAFHDRFRDHAARIMARYGFRILAMWESCSPDKLAFVYLLSWASEAEMGRAWNAFMADAEWAEIKRLTAAEHGRMVGEIESRVLHPVPYSKTLEPRDE
ncbi:MAG: NIPSNAP family protein [Rhizobiaceae bacterium]|nr:NIPSNAP family protein [Rhizobiaceae bacterium]MCV0405972.1 NIPSNAP family protein [Rhizobiaceae bacterium]